MASTLNVAFWEPEEKTQMSHAPAPDLWRPRNNKQAVV